jgi:hypothetical protein
MGEKQPVEPAVLEQAIGSENMAIKAVAALLKLQLGDTKALSVLQQLDNWTDANRDNVRNMVLQTAIRYKFQAVTPWAVKLAGEANANASITFLALRAGILFGSTDAAVIWTKRFESSTSPADRIRYSILAIDLADKLQPSLFDVMAKDDQELVKQMAIVGRLMAQKQDATAETIKLLNMNNVLTSQWVLQQGTEGADIAKAKPLLIAVIQAAEGGANDPRFRAQRLESAVIATQQLVEKAPDAKNVLADLFMISPAMTQEAMLMGLVRSSATKPQELIAGIKQWKSEQAAALALLLRAKHNDTLSEPEMEQLKLIVRGGAGLQDPLRVQAAWIYLKRTGQDKVAIASILGK